jgi:two-component sensor histidine kinase/DNA-binding response OmpR family regulator
MTKQRILLVEDSPTQALRLLFLLEEQGYETEHVESAEEALRVLNRTVPHLLIVDHHLPGLQGADLCRQVRLHVATLSMPILVLTADETPARQREGLDSGADDFLPKSTDPAVLMLRVRNLLRHARRDVDVDVLPQTVFRQPRALLAGFHADDARELEALLLEEGCLVERASDAEAAQRSHEQTPMDGILLAERLPGRGWIDFARHVATHSQQAPAIILVMRDVSGGQLTQEMLEAGVSDIYVQGAPLAPLRARLRAIMRRRFLEEQNRRLLADFREREGRALMLEAERNAAQARAALADQLAAANKRLADQALITSTITRNVRTGLILTNAAGAITYINPPAQVLLGPTVTNEDPHCLFARLGIPLENGVLPGEITDRSATLTASDGRVVPVLFSVTPLLESNGGADLPGTVATTGAVVQIIDVTERRQAEERQALLMAELSHRVKNTLATVLSIGAQTRRRQTSIDGFWTSFEGRLRALSETHNLLAEHFWEWVELRDVIGHEVTPYAQTPQDVTLVGPGIELRPRAALALGLVFHELATNAAKYGAFLKTEGRLNVYWQLVERDGKSVIMLEWQETGGPPTVPPSQSGFGSTLIRQSIAYELQGKSALDFQPGGLCCRLEIPMGPDLRLVTGSAPSAIN